MNAQLHYTVEGPEAAPTLVLGPSLGTTGAIWQPQLPALAERFRVVRYDHRGHGASPNPPTPWQLADLGADVLALLDTLGTDRVHLGGISLGGMIAGWVAAHAPDRVDRLALIATSPRFGTAETWADRAATVRNHGLAAIADATLGRWLPAAFPTRHPGVTAWVRQMLVNTPAQGYAGCCDALAEADLTPVLGQIKAPTLVIAGADDPASPPEHAQALATGIPSASVSVIPDAAHLVGVAQPETLSRLLLDFYQEAP